MGLSMVMKSVLPLLQILVIVGKGVSMSGEQLMTFKTTIRAEIWNKVKRP